MKNKTRKDKKEERIDKDGAIKSKIMKNYSNSVGVGMTRDEWLWKVSQIIRDKYDIDTVDVERFIRLWRRK